MRPDIIVLGGDYVARRQLHEPGGSHRHFVEPGIAVLARTARAAGPFRRARQPRLCRGRRPDPARRSPDHGLTELTNAGVWLERGNARLRICGVDDCGRGHPWLPPALGDMTAQ